MFVYGPPGNGKTVISQAIHNLLEGELFIPHALEVEGSIIRFFDPVNHEPLPEDEHATDSISVGDFDRRWVRCRRPMVMVGGELSLEQLELSYSQRWVSIGRRCRRSPTAACWSSTTSAVRRARRAICSTAGSCRSKAASIF